MADQTPLRKLMRGTLLATRMAVMTRGRQRSGGEYADLLGAVGLGSL